MAAPLQNVFRPQFLLISQRIARHFSKTTVFENFGSRGEPKRFYKEVHVSQANGGGFEINLDAKKLKTPLGSLFKVPTEALALTVASEWSSQEKTIKRHSMHVTALCNTAIDNPTHRDNDTTIEAILHYLDTDTICYRLDEPLELAELQTREWDPLVHWFQKRYQVPLHVTTSMSKPPLSEETKNLLKQHLLSYGDWSLNSFQFAVETVKSLVITLAVVDKFISVEQAIKLSGLEQEFQVAKWGNVEWYHGIELVDLRARLAAAVLFINLSNEQVIVQTKQKVHR